MGDVQPHISRNPRNRMPSIPRRKRDHEELDRYLKYAGEPVDRITILGATMAGSRSEATG